MPETPDIPVRSERAEKAVAGLIVLAILAVGVLVGGSLWVETELDWLVQADRVTSLTERSSQVDTELDRLRQNLDRSHLSLGELGALEWKARVIHGLRAAPFEPASRVGAPTPEATGFALDRLFGLDLRPGRPRVNDKLGRAADYTEDILNRASRLRTSFEEIVVSMETRADEWARIPSLNPIDAGRVTSNYGYRRDPFSGRRKWHGGVDFRSPTGTPILATGDGVVSKCGWFTGYGKMVEVDHGNGLKTRYAHTSRTAVRAGDQVKRGEVIAYVGRTGRASAPHLHYEVRLDDHAVNPRPYVFADFLHAD